MSQELSPRARALLDAVREVDTPAADRLARGRVVVLAAARATIDPSTPPGVGRRLALVVGTLILALVVPGPGGAMPRRIEPSFAVFAAPVIEPADATRVVVDLPSVASVAVPSAAPLRVAVAPVERPARPDASRRAPRGVATPDDGGELPLVRAAQQALRAGDAAAALRSAQEHERRFPHGVLAAERTLVHARALCALGRGDRARALARAALRDRADSHLASQLRRVCDDASSAGTETTEQ